MVATHLAGPTHDPVLPGTGRRSRPGRHEGEPVGDGRRRQQPGGASPGRSGRMDAARPRRVATRRNGARDVRWQPAEPPGVHHRSDRAAAPAAHRPWRAQHRPGLLERRTTCLVRRLPQVLLFGRRPGDLLGRVERGRRWPGRRTDPPHQRRAARQRPVRVARWFLAGMADSAGDRRHRRLGHPLGHDRSGGAVHFGASSLDERFGGHQPAAMVRRWRIDHHPPPRAGGADFDLVRIDVSTGRLEPLGFNSSSNDEYPSL